MEAGKFDVNSNSTFKLGSMTSDRPLWVDVKFNPALPLIRTYAAFHQ